MFTPCPASWPRPFNSLDRVLVDPFRSGLTTRGTLPSGFPTMRSARSRIASNDLASRCVVEKCTSVTICKCAIVCVVVSSVAICMEWAVKGHVMSQCQHQEQIRTVTIHQQDRKPAHTHPQQLTNMITHPNKHQTLQPSTTQESKR